MGVRTMLYVVVYLYLLYVTVVFPAYITIFEPIENLNTPIVPILGVHIAGREFETSFGYNTYGEDLTTKAFIMYLGIPAYLAYPIISSERYFGTYKYNIDHFVDLYI